MKTVKRVLALLLVTMLLCGCFTACAEDGGADKYKIGVIQLMEHEALDAATEGFKQAIIDELGEDAVEFDVQNGQGDATTCSTIANQFVSNNVDLIMANATPRVAGGSGCNGGYSDPRHLGDGIRRCTGSERLQRYGGRQHFRHLRSGAAR